jgi:hypothetical protein
LLLSESSDEGDVDALDPRWVLVRALLKAGDARYLGVV